MILKRDNLRLGMILGLIGPILGMVILKYIKAPSSTFSEFIDMFFNDNRYLTSIGSLSLLVNVILFTIYINTHRDHTAKGIFLITLIYGIGILVLKILN
jgi:hypothetical protein